MRAHPGVFAFVVSADHVRGDRQPLEVLDVERPFAMSRR